MRIKRKQVVFVIPSFLLFVILLGGYLYIDHLLSLPFRATNDALHQRNSDFNLDFLIPGGVYIDEDMTIEDVAKVRMKREKAFYERWTQAIFDLIPVEYRYLANLIFFLFWLLCFMTFFRVFTFMGYSRSLRTSLLFGSLTYYFMPDFAPGSGEDSLLVGLVLSFITGRWIVLRRKRKKESGVLDLIDRVNDEPAGKRRIPPSTTGPVNRKLPPAEKDSTPKISV